MEASAARWTILQVREVVDLSGGLRPEHRELVRRFAPDFVTLPEPPEGSKTRPYPSGPFDYHPRPPEIVLDRALAITNRPPIGATLGQVLVAAVAAMALTVWSAPLPDSTFGWVGFAASLLVVWVVAFLCLRYATAVLWSHLRADRIRDAVGRDLPAGLSRCSLITDVGKTPLSGTNPQASWEAYPELAADPKYPRTVYVHVTEHDGRADLTLQFWMFYFFNDWWNVHESDWECVTMFFSRDHQVPAALAYSTHWGSRWRLWPDVHLREAEGDEKHPLVYVARGSHANYFAPKPSGYLVSGTVSLNLLSRIRVLATGAWFDPPGRKRDFVPDVDPAVASSTPSESSLPYRLVAVPHDPAMIDPSADADRWTKLWWLRMGARWDRSGSIGGPMHQAQDRWRAPFAWVADAGSPDTDWPGAFDQLTMQPGVSGPGAIG